MVPTYYTIKFSDLDGYYDGESQFDTYEQAKQAFDELVKEDGQYGVYEYSMMELLKCGNGEEPDCRCH